MPIRTHYDNLKVARSAPSEAIRAAYKALAQRHHPDKNPSPDSHRIMKMINDAYDVLSDPRRRAEHDAWIDECLRAEEVRDSPHRAENQESHRQDSGQATHAQSAPSPPPSTSNASGTSSNQKSPSGGATDFVRWAILFAGLCFVLLLASERPEKTAAPARGTPENNAVALNSGTSRQQELRESQSPVPLAASASLDKNVTVNATSGAIPAEYTTAIDSRSLLSLVCDERDIIESSCKDAKNYPRGDYHQDRESCPIELMPPRLEGRFLSAKTSTIITRYLSDCEPGFNDYGGSLVFERVANAITFIGYFPGSIIYGCIPVAKGTGTENLVCVYFAAQGAVRESSVSEVEFTRDSNGVLSHSRNVVARASRHDEDWWGPNTVDCTSDLHLFDLISSKLGPAPRTVIVEAKYADKATIRKACTSTSEPTGTQAKSPPPGKAYIYDRDIWNGQIMVDLTTHTIMPLSEFRRRDLRQPVVAVEAGDELKKRRISLGHEIDGEQRVRLDSSVFLPTDNIYASILTDAPKAAILTAIWTYGDHNQLVSTNSVLISGGSRRTAFLISNPDAWPVGSYSVAIQIDGSDVASRAFAESDTRADPNIPDEHPGHPTSWTRDPGHPESVTGPTAV